MTPGRLRYCTSRTCGAPDCATCYPDGDPVDEPVVPSRLPEGAPVVVPIKPHVEPDEERPAARRVV